MHTIEQLNFTTELILTNGHSYTYQDVMPILEDVFIKAKLKHCKTLIYFLPHEVKYKMIPSKHLQYQRGTECLIVMFICFTFL